MASLDLIQKLIAHEKSARKIGSIAEADAFAAKIRKLQPEREPEPQARTYRPSPPPAYRAYEPYRAYHEPRRAWHDDPATEKQMQTVERLYKLRGSSWLTKGQASRLIRAFFEEEQQ